MMIFLFYFTFLIKMGYLVDISKLENLKGKITKRSYLTKYVILLNKIKRANFCGLFSIFI